MTLLLDHTFLHDSASEVAVGDGTPAMELSTSTTPATVYHAVYNNKTRTHAPASSSTFISLLFECEHDATHAAPVVMTRNTALASVAQHATALYAGSVPEKLRGVRVAFTVNGYTTNGLLTVGDLYDALQPDSGVLQVLCQRTTAVRKCSKH